MKYVIYTFISAVLAVGFSYSAQAQTDPAADASLVTADTELGTADTELGTANTTLKAIQTAVEGVQTSVTQPTDVIGKFSALGASTNIPTTQVPQMDGVQGAGATATEFSTGEDGALTSDEAAGILKGSSVQKQQLTRFKEIDANIVGGAADDADAFGKRYADVDKMEDTFNGQTSLIQATALVGVAAGQVAKSVDLVGVEVADAVKAIGAVSAEKHQRDQAIMDDHNKTALEFLTP